MVRAAVWVAIAAVSAVAGAAEAEKTATSTLKDATGKTVGTATFTEKVGRVALTVKVSGLPPGKHGFHVHETGKCDPPGFTSAGVHFNPSAKGHGAKNPAGKHAGDLPNLEVKPDGTAEVTASLEGVTLGKSRASLLKEGGTALVIHAGPDDEKTDPTGNSGDRIACGEIVSR